MNMTTMVTAMTGATKATTKRLVAIAALAATLGVLSPGAASAADKTYQVTGPVLEVTDKVITVEKGKEKWQIARDKDTKITGDLKLGAKVTIEYRMTATTVEVKGGDAKTGSTTGSTTGTKTDKPAKK